MRIHYELGCKNAKILVLISSVVTESVKISVSVLSISRDVLALKSPQLEKKHDYIPKILAVLGHITAWIYTLKRRQTDAKAETAVWLLQKNSYVIYILHCTAGKNFLPRKDL